MDYCDLDTSQKITVQNVTFLPAWLYMHRHSIENAPESSRSSYITKRIGFSANAGAIISFLKKTGLVDHSLKVSQLATLLATGRITYEEFCLLHLSKQSLYLRNEPKVSFLALLCKYILHNPEVSSYDLRVIRTLNLDLLPMPSDNVNNSRNDYIVTVLEGSGLFNHQDDSRNGLMTFTPDILPIIELIHRQNLQNCEYPLNSKIRFDLFSNFEGGIIDSLPDDLPNKWNELFPHLNNRTIQQYKKIFSNSYHRMADVVQQIFYGAPGTGKSNTIKKLTGEIDGDRKFGKDFTFRTTFHPDSDYSSFVGAYKPYWHEGQGIKYGFRPQTFIKAYIKAWTNPNENVALVVEEINRGNCAQIFGDIFQLLDRDKNGLSKYPIECDVDLEDFIKKEFETGEQFGLKITEEAYLDKKDVINDYYSKHYDDAFDKIKSGKILVLPQNLSILATMNTSDQSLFPMDSAFKRRWEWIYEPITEGIDKNGNKLEWKIKIDDNKKVNWWKFLERINEEIRELTLSEDKQLGYFFLNPDLDDKTISIDLFVGKVIFYLWNEIFKDYAFDRKCCKTADEKDIVYFANFYNKETRKVDIDVVINFFEKLKKNNNDDSLIEESSNIGDNAGQVATTDSPAPQPGAQMTLDM